MDDEVDCDCDCAECFDGDHASCSAEEPCDEYERLKDEEE